MYVLIHEGFPLLVIDVVKEGDRLISCVSVKNGYLLEVVGDVLNIYFDKGRKDKINSRQLQKYTLHEVPKSYIKLSDDEIVRKMMEDINANG